MRPATCLGVALVCLGLVPAASAHDFADPTPKFKLYRFSLAGTPALAVSWTVTPADSESVNGAFLVVSGSACGPDPLRARWKFTRQGSTSGNLPTKTVNFRSANPSSIYVGSYANAGDIKVKAKLSSARPWKVSLVVTATPSFSKIAFIPKTALVVSKPVKSCP